MTHTPGPWKIYNAYELVGKPGMICALRIASKDKTVIEPAQYDTDLKMSEADARLIAKAPELLEVCKDALRYFESMGLDGLSVAEELIAVIAEVEGEEPA